MEMISCYECAADEHVHHTQHRYKRPTALLFVEKCTDVENGPLSAGSGTTLEPHVDANAANARRNHRRPQPQNVTAVRRVFPASTRALDLQEAAVRSKHSLHLLLCLCILPSSTLHPHLTPLPQLLEAAHHISFPLSILFQQYRRRPRLLRFKTTTTTTTAFLSPPASIPENAPQDGSRSL